MARAFPWGVCKVPKFPTSLLTPRVGRSRPTRSDAVGMAARRPAEIVNSDNGGQGCGQEHISSSANLQSRCLRVVVTAAEP